MVLKSLLLISNVTQWSVELSWLCEKNIGRVYLGFVTGGHICLYSRGSGRSCHMEILMEVSLLSFGRGSLPVLRFPCFRRPIVVGSSVPMALSSLRWLDHEMTRPWGQLDLIGVRSLIVRHTSGSRVGGFPKFSSSALVLFGSFDFFTHKVRSIMAYGSLFVLLRAK
jgi:hypothetical protein